MPSDAAGTVGAYARLHPLSPLFAIASAAWKLLLPGIVVLVLASRGSRYELWLMVLFVPAVASALLRYISFRYRLGDDELVIREGIVNRKERHIPYGRIQNVDLVQNPFHRMLRVAEVRIETAGGDEPEANIQVLSADAVEQMRERVFRDREPAAAAKTDRGTAPDAATTEDAPTTAAPRTTEPETRLLQLGRRDIALYGIISNRGMAIVAALWGLAWQAGFDWSPEWLQPWLDPRAWMNQDVKGWLARYDVGWASPLVTSGFVIGGLLLALAMMRVLSVVWAAFKLHGFTLTRRGDDLRTTFGLFTRRSATVPSHRIQLLTVRETVLHRWFGRLEIKVETAGGKEGAETEVSRQLLVPLLHTGRLGELLREIQPKLDADGLSWQPVDPRAWNRIVRRTVAFWLVVGAIATPALGWKPWVVVALLLPLVLLVARRGFLRMAYAVTPHAAVYRSGWWVRKLSIVPLNKIQVVHLGQSPFDRRWQMATVHVDTAGAREGGHRVRIPFLPEATAQALFGRLGTAAAATEFRW